MSLLQGDESKLTGRGSISISLLTELRAGVSPTVRWAHRSRVLEPSLTVGLMPPPQDSSTRLLQDIRTENSTSSLFSRKESANVQASGRAGVDGRERR
jgi:hypothetical protein